MLILIIRHKSLSHCTISGVFVDFTTNLTKAFFFILSEVISLATKYMEQTQTYSQILVLKIMINDLCSQLYSSLFDTVYQIDSQVVYKMTNKNKKKTYICIKKRKRIWERERGKETWITRLGHMDKNPIRKRWQIQHKPVQSPNE